MGKISGRESGKEAGEEPARTRIDLVRERAGQASLGLCGRSEELLRYWWGSPGVRWVQDSQRDT